jgi:hypothetical protein
MDRTSAGSFRVVGRGMSPKRTWTGSRDVWQTPSLGRVRVARLAGIDWDEGVYGGDQAN